MIKRRSPIWKVSKEELQSFYDKESSASGILKCFGLSNKGNNFKTLKQRAVAEGICLQQHNLNKELAKNHKGIFKEIPLEDILKENSNYDRRALKKRLIKNNLLRNVCEKCGIGPVWNGEKLVLQLEHKNGNSTDNRLINLCLLCPNCHSQTKTFAGRKLKRVRKSLNSPRPERRKVEWPDKDLLEKLLWEKSTTQIAKEYGVSDNAVSKWAKRYGLKKPPRGYWGFKK